MRSKDQLLVPESYFYYSVIKWKYIALKSFKKIDILNDTEIMR
jgi:hypothetical protein